jgi:hypothetical protein
MMTNDLLQCVLYGSYNIVPNIASTNLSERKDIRIEWEGIRPSVTFVHSSPVTHFQQEDKQNERKKRNIRERRTLLIDR